MNTRIIILSLATAVGAVAVGPLAPLPAFAADEVNISLGGTMAGPGRAVHGYDVVSFLAGKPTVGLDANATAYQGATYTFASKANLDAFLADPVKYLPAYGGYCAYGVAVGKKLDGDPRYWKVVAGRLYLNLNGDVQETWAKDVPGNVAKADATWQRIQSTAVGKL